MQNKFERPYFSIKQKWNAETSKDDGKTAVACNSKKNFVSAQRRYDNVRIRDSEILNRLCCECGMVLCGERKYQEHIILHESSYLVYELYYSKQKHEGGGGDTKIEDPRNESGKQHQEVTSQTMQFRKRKHQKNGSCEEATQKVKKIQSSNYAKEPDN